TANVFPADITRPRVETELRAMPLEQRMRLVAIAHHGDASAMSLRGQPLVDYVTGLEDIGNLIGSQDPVRTIHYLRTVYGSSDATAVSQVNTFLHTLRNDVGIDPASLADPAVTSACIALNSSSSCITDPTHHPYTARAVQLYGAAITERQVATL